MRSEGSGGGRGMQRSSLCLRSGIGAGIAVEYRVYATGTFET